MELLNRTEAILKSHSSIVRKIGDVCYDIDGNVVEVDESVVQAYIDANGYKIKRQVAYPSVVDQLDTLYHGGYDAWKAMIQKIKEDIPKP